MQSQSRPPITDKTQIDIKPTPELLKALDDFAAKFKETATTAVGKAVYMDGYKDGCRDTVGVSGIVSLLIVIVIHLTFHARNGGQK